MQVLQMAGEFTTQVQEIAFGLSLLITGLFCVEYRRYHEQQKRQDMLDRFLKD